MAICRRCSARTDSPGGSKHVLGEHQLARSDEWLAAQARTSRIDRTKDRFERAGSRGECKKLEVFYMSAPLVVERVTIGPQGAFAKVPDLDVGYRLLTKVFPLGRGKIVEREGKVFVSTPPGRQSRRGIA